MTLSRYEQRVLAEMEQELAAWPVPRGLRQWWPRGQSVRVATRGQATLAGLSAAAGITLLAVGLVSTNGVAVVAAVIGYALVVLATLSAVTAITHRPRTRAAHQRAQPRNPPPQSWHDDESGPGDRP